MWPCPCSRTPRLTIAIGAVSAWSLATALKYQLRATSKLPC